MPEVIVRPLTEADVPAAQKLSHESLADAGTRYGWVMPALDDAVRERGERRIRHVLRHDPAGAFVAEVDGRLAGISLATRREQYWFLSLLTVSPDAQNAGVGRLLLDAALGTFEGTGSLCASDDPKALRRYRHAGFDLRPCYEAKGVVDRSLIPAVSGVRDGSFDSDRDLVETVAVAQRGAPHGPDLDYYRDAQAPLLVTDTALGSGYVIVRPSGPAILGATTEGAATALLWSVLAQSSDEVEISWLTADQQWAVDVVLAARLPLRPTGSHCVAGQVGPLAPYLPSGAFG